MSGTIDLIVEANVLSSLDHPNIVKLHAVRGGDPCESHSHDGGHYIVLELLNCTVDSLLETRRSRDMTYLHAKNIIFRDLKPENVGFNQQRTVHISYFGLAREYHPSIPIENVRASKGSRRIMCHCRMQCTHYNGIFSQSSAQIFCTDDALRFPEQSPNIPL